MKNHKFIYNILLTFFILIMCGNQALGSDQMTLDMQGKQFDNVPYMIEDGELLAPAKIVLQELGGKLEWYGKLKVLRVLFDDNYEVRMWINNSKISVNPGNKIEQLPVAPRLLNNQTMIPLKYFADHFGLLFSWDDKVKVARVYKPSNWVLDLSFDEELTGERLTITSTKKVPYATHILPNPDRLVIDLKQSSLSARSSDLLWESYVFNSVRVSQFDMETVRVVIELNNQVQYKILEEESPEGFKIIIAFAPGIRDILVDDKGIHIKASGEISEYSLLELPNPDRLVLDIKDQTLQLGTKSIPLNNPLAKQIRASQLSWDPKVVRLVLDLNTKIEYNVLRGETAQEIILQLRDGSDQLIAYEEPDETGEDTTGTVTTDGSASPFATMTEFILLDIGKQYGDHELVSIGVTEGVNQRVIIRTSTPIYYKVSYLPNPDRLVVDLQGAIVKFKSDQLPGGKGIIKEVRMHQYPDKVRVVFDLTQYNSHKILSEERTQVIEIGLGKNPLDGRVIVIDPGHGGTDPGAVGAGGFYEKVVTLDIGLLLRDLLKNAGATVIMTREADIYPTLGERTDLANQLNADIFVSVHCNSFIGEDPGGTETFIPPTPREKNRELATAIHRNLVQMIQLFDRGVKSDDFFVLNHTTMPAVLVEVAFISKEDEAKLLKDVEFLKKAATGIYEGILGYFSQLLESGEDQ